MAYPLTQTKHPDYNWTFLKDVNLRVDFESTSQVNHNRIIELFEQEIKLRDVSLPKLENGISVADAEIVGWQELVKA